ncbi:unnamed protein product [Schistosoma turkestanicum]|nr:unnamed protein product [Schistosoma turkestanicum]
MKTFIKKRDPGASNNEPESNKVKGFFSRFGGGLRSAFFKPHQPSVPVVSCDANNDCHSSDDLNTSKGVEVSASSKTVDDPLPLSKSGRISSAIRILNESPGSNPRPSYIRESVSRPQNSSAFREELNLKLQNRPGYNPPPRLTIAKSAESSDSLISIESSSPNQKHFNSPHSFNRGTHVLLTTPSNSIHESINSISSSSGTPDLASLQHKLAVSRPRNRRPPSKAYNRASILSDESVVDFFPSSLTTPVSTNHNHHNNNNHNLVSLSNSQLGLIKEEGEILNQISEQTHQKTSTINLTTEIISTVNTDELISKNSDSNKLDSSISRINLRDSIKCARDSNSLKRKSDYSYDSDHTPTPADQETITPFKPLKKNAGFERIKINPTSDFHNLAPLASYNGSDQRIRPRSMLISSSGIDNQLSQICLKTKHVNNDVNAHHHDINPDISKRSSEPIPSIVFIPCKASVDNNNNHTIISNNGNSSSSNTNGHNSTVTKPSSPPVSMSKKSPLIDVETNLNKYPKSSSPQAVGLHRKRSENSHLVTTTLKDL